MDEIAKAIMFGVRVTWWLAQLLFRGYVDLFNWFGSKDTAYPLPFPAASLVISIALTIVALLMAINGS